MRSIAIRMIKAGGRLFCPLPTFFDLCLAGFLLLPFFKGYVKQVYFIFYIISLVCISIGQRPKREYHSIPLMLLSLWALLGVFIHSFVIEPASVTMRYLNMYLLSEGAIYILFGSLFMVTTIRYSQNTKILNILIPIAMIPLIREVIKGNMTFVFAVLVSAVVYFILNRKFIMASFLMACGITFVHIKWAWIVMKFNCRPVIWEQLIREIIKHPFMGSGWNKTLAHPDNMLWVDNYGWLYRHNDYLSLGAFMGIIATLFLVWFAIDSLKQIGRGINLIPFLAILLMCFFQMTMFLPERAGLYILIGALCLKASYKEAR